MTDIGEDGKEYSVKKSKSGPNTLTYTLTYSGSQASNKQKGGWNVKAGVNTHRSREKPQD